MHVFEAIEKRRAIKKYDSSHVITLPEIKRLMDAARLSPTSFNIQNWRFVVVTDKDLRQKIRAHSWDQAQVTDASALIIICGDVKSWGKNIANKWRNAPPEIQEYMSNATVNFYETRGEQTQRDEVMRSAGMAAQTIMLAAQEMGYDTGPMIGFDPVEVGKLINLPEDHVIGMYVVIGKALEPARPRSGQIDESEAVFYNHFPA